MQSPRPAGRQRGAWLYGLLATVACGAVAATLPVYEGFEGYSDGTPVNTTSALTNGGWGASDNTVVVRTVTNVADAVRGTNALAIPPGLSASNCVSASLGQSNVWLEIYAHTSMGMAADVPSSEDVDTNLAVEAFLDTNGWPVVWNPTSSVWQVCTQDVWQTPVAAFATSAWARLTLCQNYSNRTVSLFLNEHLLFAGWRFINTNLTGYSVLQADGGMDNTSLLDEISVRYQPPTNPWSADLDDDGMLDAVEIQLYGDVAARHRPVITVTATGSGTVDPAGSFEVFPGGQTNFTMTAGDGCYVATLRTNGQSVGSFLGQYTNAAAYTWTDIIPDGLSDGSFEAVFVTNPAITAVSPANGGVSPDAVSTYPFTPAAFSLVASNGYYLANVYADGAAAGGFPGRYTMSGAFTWPSVALTGGVLTLEVAANPVVSVVAPTNGAVSPLDPSVPPFASQAFTFTASNGYYVAAVYTNETAVGAFPGQFTNAASYTWPSVDLPGGVLRVAFAQKPQVTLVASAVGGPSGAGGSGSLSASEVYPGGSVTCSLTAETAYAVSALLTNGGVATTFAGQPQTASYTVSNIWADLQVTAVFAYTARLTVTNDYATIAAALNAAMTGDTIVVTGGSYTNDLTIDRSVTLQGTNVTVAGSVALQNGATGVLAGCEGFVVTGATTVAAGTTLVVSNGSVNVGTLAIAAGGTVQVFNATAFVADGATLTGTFTLDSGWGTTVVPQTPPYSDPFERYTAGTKLRRMGYFGWDTTSDGVVVETNQIQSGRAVEVPAGSSLGSQMTATVASNVWIECYYMDTNRVPMEEAVLAEIDTNMAAELVIGTNGYVTVYDPAQSQWVVCSNDVAGNSVAPLSASAWPRISLNVNYARGHVAVFLNGRLLKEQLRFINTNLTNSGRFELVAGYEGPTYLDTFSVWTNWSGIVSDDSDGDGIPDALEIDRHGNLATDPVGTVFKFR